MSLVEGSTFGGRYRVVRCIAAGGMGAVYEVVHLETNRRRALKVMLPHVLQTPALRERFQLEAKVAADIESDFIVDVFDAGYDEATKMPFLVMELLRGEELGKRLQRVGRLPPSEVVTVLHQTSLALDKTHRASIVHRDLKPENLFLTEREDGPPRIKVLDFGVAKIVAESATSGGATQSIGTPLYMAPEQFNPSAHLTGAADLYALAMVAFKLLVGVTYWAEEARGGNVFALAAVAMHGPREPATARARRSGVHLPPAFDGWFAHATALNPKQRFPTAAEMVSALAYALGEPLPGRAAMPSREAMESPPLSRNSNVPTEVLPMRARASAQMPNSAPVRAHTPPPAIPAPAPPQIVTAPATASSGSLVPPRRSTAPLVIGAALATLGAAALIIVRSRPVDAPPPRTDSVTANVQPAIAAQPAAPVATVEPSDTADPTATESATVLMPSPSPAPNRSAPEVATAGPRASAVPPTVPRAQSGKSTGPVKPPAAKSRYSQQ